MSKTLTANAAKTVLALKKYFWLLAVLILLAVVGIELWRQRALQLIYVDDSPLLVSVASTPSARKMGLSYQLSLPKGQGMLFEYSEPSQACMWMKEMSFPLDVYWFSATGKLISSAHDLSPESYPATYCPNVPAFYMLEVNVNEFYKEPKAISIPKQ